MTRRLLACSSAGGHFRQLLSLVDRVPGADEVTWLTHDRGLARDLLDASGRGDDRLVHAPYAAPRDVLNLARDARVADRLLREVRPDLAISTGAGIAVATLPLARARGARACFIESATREAGPSLSGRILQRTPGVELYTQNPGEGYGRRWGHVGSVHDEFAPGPEHADAGPRRVVVTVGTIRPYGFRRLLQRLLDVLPGDAEVLWQTGVTPVGDLPIDAREHVPATEMEAAMAQADVVVAHAGTGSALTAFAAGRCPVLVPRRRTHGEHVDDHQVGTARMLAYRGLALYVEADELSEDHMSQAAARSVVRREDPAPLAL